MQANAGRIRHVHLSELGLPPVAERPLHKRLAALLEEAGYAGYVSLEMAALDDAAPLESCLRYLRRVFGPEEAMRA